MRLGRYLIFGGAAVALTPVGRTGRGAREPGMAAQYNDKGEMLFPAGYRAWTFVTSSHAMSCNALANAASPEGPFDNVFVNPDAYAAFLKTGHWPEGTVLVLEIRGSTSKGSINKSGAFQSGGAAALVEVHVRDSTTLQGRLGLFGFDGKKPAAMIGYRRQLLCLPARRMRRSIRPSCNSIRPCCLSRRRSATLSAGYLASEKAAGNR